MYSKRVLMSYCGFCKKRGQRSDVIHKHELHCTLNPNRVCNVYKLIDTEQRPMKELVAFFAGLGPSGVDEFMGAVWLNTDIEGVAIALKALREECNNCPACIMAALRQAKIPVPLAKSFNFTDEMAAVWRDVNETGREPY